MGNVSKSNVAIKFKMSKLEIEKMDAAIFAGYGLSRPDLCRQATKRYLLMIDPHFDTDIPYTLDDDTKNAKSYHIYMKDGVYRCDITNAICDCIISEKDCRSCVVPIEHTDQRLTMIKSKN